MRQRGISTCAPPEARRAEERFGLGHVILPRGPLMIAQPAAVVVVFTNGHSATHPGDGQGLHAGLANPTDHLDLSDERGGSLHDSRTGENERQNNSSPVLKGEGC